MEKYFSCIIVIKNRGVLNISKEKLKSKIDNLFEDEFGAIKAVITAKENYPEYRSSIYLDLDMRGKLSFFDMYIDYHSYNEEVDVHINRITKILNYLWSLNVPAATYYEIDDDFEDHLPLKGGNDLDKVFWKDPDLEGI